MGFSPGGVSLVDTLGNPLNSYVMLEALDVIGEHPSHYSYHRFWA